MTGTLNTLKTGYWQLIWMMEEDKRILLQFSHLVWEVMFIKYVKRQTSGKTLRGTFSFFCACHDTLYLYCKAMDNYEFYISGDLFYVFPWVKII